MILEVEMDVFKLLTAGGTSPVYMLDGYEKITVYTAKPPMIIKSTYVVPIDEETGVPGTEDLQMWKTDFFTDAIPILSAKEEHSVKMKITSE